MSLAQQKHDRHTKSLAKEFVSLLDDLIEELWRSTCSANPRGPIYNLDPEIERTQRDLKRRARRLMEGNGNSGRQPANRQNLPAPAGGAIAPPIP
ncbi:hypothetical protein V6N13_148448 [Hibiscus sabdariffa]